MQVWDARKKERGPKKKARFIHAPPPPPLRSRAPRVLLPICIAADPPRSHRTVPRCPVVFKYFSDVHRRSLSLSFFTAPTTLLLARPLSFSFSPSLSLLSRATPLRSLSRALSLSHQDPDSPFPSVFRGTSPREIISLRRQPTRAPCTRTCFYAGSAERGAQLSPIKRPAARTHAHN